MPETLRARTREMWVRSVLAVGNSATDISTVKEWVRMVGVSERRFRDLCALLHVSPKASLDFARMLRLVVQQKTSAPDDELAADDIRTVNRLTQQAGLPREVLTLDFRIYLQCQTFIASTECLAELSKSLDKQKMQSVP